MMKLDTKRQLSIEQLERFPIGDVDTDSDDTGVLLSDRISYYAESFHMIDPFESKHLKAAGYELTVGDEFYIGGEKYEFEKKDSPSFIEIPPFDVAVIKTHEILRLPRFLIARWNLRVKWAYEGLLWIGAAQVDPGYAGHLFCPIYNLSDKRVRLPQGEPIALIDFVKTTKFKEGRSIEYPKPSDREKNIIEDYGCDDLKSALITHAQERIASTDERIDEISHRLSWFITITVSILTVAITIALALNSFENNIAMPRLLIPIILFTTVFSFIAALLFIGTFRFRYILSSIRSMLIGRRTSDIATVLRKEWRISFYIFPIVSLLAGFAGYYIANATDFNLNNRLESMESAIRKIEASIARVNK